MAARHSIWTTKIRIRHHGGVTLHYGFGDVGGSWKRFVLHMKLSLNLSVELAFEIKF